MTKQDKTDQEVDRALDRELQTLLAVDSPADFETRLRARIAREEMRKQWTRPWMFAVAGAVAAAAMVVFLMLPSHETVPSPQTPKVQVASTGDPTPLPIPNAPIAEAKTELKAAPNSRRLSRIQNREPELLIAANEANALRRVFTGPPLRLSAEFSGPVETNEVRTPAIVIEPLDAPAPIRIEPIELPIAAQPAGGQ